MTARRWPLGLPAICSLLGLLCVACGARTAASTSEHLRLAAICAIGVDERAHWLVAISGSPDSLLAATAKLEMAIDALPSSGRKDERLSKLVLRRFNSSATEYALAARHAREVFDAGVPAYPQQAVLHAREVVAASNAQTNAMMKFFDTREEVVAIELHVLGTREFLDAWLARARRPAPSSDRQIGGRHWADSVWVGLEHSYLPDEAQ